MRKLFLAEKKSDFRRCCNHSFSSRIPCKLREYFASRFLLWNSA